MVSVAMHAKGTFGISKCSWGWHAVLGRFTVGGETALLYWLISSSNVCLSVQHDKVYVLQGANLMLALKIVLGRKKIVEISPWEDVGSLKQSWKLKGQEMGKGAVILKSWSRFSVRYVNAQDDPGDITRWVPGSSRQLAHCDVYKKQFK